MIGTHKIIAPPKDILDFKDGLALAEQYIEPLTSGFCKERIQIAFLIPEDRPLRENGCGYSTITASFFVGLFEELITNVRNTQIPDLSVTVARSKMRAVETKGDQGDSRTVVSDLFDIPWNTYDPIERFLNKTLAIGVSHQDGTHTLAEYDNDRMMKEISDEDTNNKAFFWSYKYYKALDSMFMSNLNNRHMIINAENTSKKPENNRS
ncbi:MAG: hypothetical protein ACPG05_00640 [Bdellovibrionales bacterium]